MDIEVNISFGVNSVFVQSGDLNKRFANVIAIEKSPNKIVAIGETYQEIAERNPERWPRLRTLTVNGVTAISKSWQYNL